MDILNKLVDEYKIDGIEIRHGTGLNESIIYPYMNGRILSTGGGISIPELSFLDVLFNSCHPKSMYCVGNAFGWSTLGFAFLCPSSKVVVIDNLVDGNDCSLGMEKTKSIVQRNNLNVVVLEAESPQDSDRIIQEHFSGKVDFVFIDGLHTNEQVVKDFVGVRSHLHQNSIVVFHDVIKHEMSEGWKEISVLAKENNFTSVVLRKTYTGMGIVYSSTPEVDKIVDLYSDD